MKHNDKIYVGLEFTIGSKHAEKFNYESYAGMKGVVVNLNHPQSEDFCVVRVGKKKIPVRKEDIVIPENQ